MQFGKLALLGFQACNQSIQSIALLQIAKPLGIG